MPTNDELAGRINELLRRIEALEDVVIAITFAYADQTRTDDLRRVLEILASGVVTDEHTMMSDRMRKWLEIRYPIR